MKPQLEASQTARDVEVLLIEAGWIQAADKRNGEPAPFLQGNSKLFVINAIHGKTEYAIGGGEGQAHATPMDAANYLLTMVRPVEPEPAPVEEYAPTLVIEAIAAEPAPVIDLAAENEALRRRIAELEAIEAPLLPAPDALMSDWGEVGAYPGIPDDFVQLMTGEETLEQAVERMTLGVDELLDMATVLSDQSLELALCTVPPERVNEWTEKLITEKARLRRLRGTVDENFGRENLVSRVQGMFAQVGAKR
jgi:hypothetical protein